MSTRIKLHIPLPDFLQPRRGARCHGRRSNLQPQQSQNQQEPERQEQQQQQQQQQRQEVIHFSPEDGNEEARRASIHAAHDFLLETIRFEGRWSAHMHLIRIDCPHTLTELHALGYLSRSEGIQECRKMVRVPVIHDEIGLFLWTRLAEMARELSFTDKDNDDETTKCAPGKEDVGRRQQQQQQQQQRTEAFLAQLEQRFRFDRPASVPARGKRLDSPPISPGQKERSFTINSSPSSSRRPSSNHIGFQLCHFCHHDSIEEREKIPEEIRNEALEATSGRTPGSSGRQRPQLSSTNQTPTSTPSLRQRSATFFNVSRNSSFVGSLIWKREQARRSSSASRASSANHHRRGSLAGRLGSVVGEVGKSVGVALGESLSHGYGGQPNRSASARSV